jgi:acetate kinase
MNILVLNCGSSSVRFQIIATEADMIEKDADRCLAWGHIEHIGGEALVSYHVNSETRVKTSIALRNYHEAIDHALRWAISPEAGIQGVRSVADIHAIGHRVVHGGERFSHCVKIDDEVVRQIEDTIELAPLHNPANLEGIRAARAIFGSGVPQVAVFDTAFHLTMPETSYLYALPYQLYHRHKLRRYGFHGTSHRYMAYRYQRLTGIAKERVNLITLHLGNGCSACAIKGGDSIDTSMGLTPTEGLVMGTRGGDMDPSIVEFLHHKEGLSLSEIDALINKQSGLLGISGLTHDMRDLLDEERETNDRRAKLAIDIFCLRVKKYIGAYLAELGEASAVVFAGGVGENSPEIRERICSGLKRLGLSLDARLTQEMKDGREGCISAQDANLKVWVIATNEELLIARDTFRVVRGLPVQF